MRDKFLILNLHAQTVSNGTVYSNGYVANATHNTPETSGNDWNPQKRKFYERSFLKNYEGKLVHSQFGEKVTIPQGNGNIANLTGITPYATRTTPLQEGITPEANLMDFYTKQVAVYTYGAYTFITDLAIFLSKDNVLIKDAENLASQAARTIEEIDANILNSGTSVIYAPAVASDGTETEVKTRSGISSLSTLTLKVLYSALNYLERNNIPKFSDGHYVAIIHPDIKYDILNNEKYQKLIEHSDPHLTKLLNGEIGIIGGIKFVESTYAKIFKNAGVGNINVYSTLVMGEGAYQIAEIDGLKMQTIVKIKSNSNGTNYDTSDPLNQKNTQGWKTSHGCGIIKETALVRIESASGSLYKSIA